MADYKEEYKGYTIVVKNRQGNGSFCAPLTNVPFKGYIYKGETLIDTTNEYSSIESAIYDAKNYCKI